MADTIVLYPSPGRSHLIPMVELGKLILTHHPSFSLTIIISEAPFETGSTAPYIEAVTATTPSINFYNLPTISIPNTNSSSSSSSSSSPTNIVALSFELSTLNNENYKQALLTLSNSCNIKALIIDFFCNSSFQVSTSLNIPTYYYHTAGLTGLTAFLYLPTIHKKFTKSLKDLNEFINIPGIPPIFAKDMPLPMLDRTRKVYEYFLETAIQMPKSAGIIVNTVEKLEERPLTAILDGECTLGEPVAPIYCIGPLLTESGSVEDKHECLGWLDKQPRQSVLFLSFGSLGKFSVKQLKEMAIGLERSGVRFLWVVRTPPPEDEKVAAGAEPSLESCLPEGFLVRTKERGFVAKGWAPQVTVLSHDSVGGFVTHCGWNSVLETLRAGVPMLAWPLYAEQNLNKLGLVDELKLALPVVKSEDGLVSAAELEKQVTELMNWKNGKSIQKRVMAMKDVVLGAMNMGGSSLVALNKLAESIKRG